MKKTSLLLAVVAGLIGGLYAIAGEVTLPIPCIKSKLCAGLGEVYNLNDDSDQFRQGVFLGQLYERDGTNIGKTTGLFGSYAADFAPASAGGTATTYLWANTAGAPGGDHTIGVWVYPTQAPGAGQHATLLSWDSSAGNNNKKGSTLRFDENRYLTYEVFSSVNEAYTTVTSSTTLTLNAWNYVAAGAGTKILADGSYGGRMLFVSLNGATKVETTLGFGITPGNSVLTIGAKNSNYVDSQHDAQWAFKGRMCQLAIWGRELPIAEIVLARNGGSGQYYPFNTEQTTTYTFYQYPTSGTVDSTYPSYSGTYDDVNDAVGANDGHSTILVFNAHTDGTTERNGYVAFPLTAPDPGVSINWVKLHVIRAKAGAGGEDVTWYVDPEPDCRTVQTSYGIVRLGSTNYSSGAFDIKNYYNTNTSSWGNGSCQHDAGGASAYVEDVYQWTTNPATGLPWYVSELQTIKIGSNFSNGSIPSAASGKTANVRVTSVYLEVNASY